VASTGSNDCVATVASSSGDVSGSGPPSLEVTSGAPPVETGGPAWALAACIDTMMTPTARTAVITAMARIAAVQIAVVMAG